MPLKAVLAIQDEYPYNTDWNFEREGPVQANLNPIQESREAIYAYYFLATCANRADWLSLGLYSNGILDGQTVARTEF